MGYGDQVQLAVAPPEPADNAVEICVARQPIFDRQLRVKAYELLFRADRISNQFNGAQSDSATAQVISSLLTIGFDRLLSGKEAFINFGRSPLVNGLAAMLPKDRVVIEVLESVKADADVVESCRRLREAGYKVALDDFVWDAQVEELARLAQVIKVDMQITSREEQERMLRSFRNRGVAMIAEKVETQEEYEWANRAGFDFFQGYFFARPAIVLGRELSASAVASLRLLRELRQPELDFRRIEKLIREDVALTYKLFRYVNSAWMRRRAEINSIPRALMNLGETGIRHWVTLATLHQMAQNRPNELITYTLVRARFCERVASISRNPTPNDAYLMGLFSLLDALLNRPLDQALQQLNLQDSIVEVLLGTAPENSSLSRIYRLVKAYETADWPVVDKLATDLGVTSQDIFTEYTNATSWASDILNGHSVAQPE